MSSTQSQNSALYDEKNWFLALTTFSAVVIAFFFLMYYLYAGSSPNDLLPTMTPLNARKDVGLPDVIDKNVLSSGSSTVAGFFKLLDGDRTGMYDAAQPFVPLMFVPQNWSLEMALSPGSEKPNQTRFRVSVKPTNTTVKEVEISLPPIPHQKWVFIAILREGRRFDFIYDNQIVASHRLEHYPVNITAPLAIGNKALRGSVIHVLIKNRRLTPTEVEEERLQFVDTNNMIPEDHSIDILFPKFTLPYFATCPPGLPCDPVSKPPQDNLLKWSTPYA